MVWAALAFGLKQIIFVAKHTGSFCWWQTETTDYGIKDTPYKIGIGAIFETCLKEFSQYKPNQQGKRIKKSFYFAQIQC